MLPSRVDHPLEQLELLGLHDHRMLGLLADRAIAIEEAQQIELIASVQEELEPAVEAHRVTHDALVDTLDLQLLAGVELALELLLGRGHGLYNT